MLRFDRADSADVNAEDVLSELFERDELALDSIAVFALLTN